MLTWHAALFSCQSVMCAGHLTRAEAAPNHEDLVSEIRPSTQLDGQNLYVESDRWSSNDFDGAAA